MDNTTGNPSGKLLLVDIEREMKKSFLDYSMSVIVERALPDVRDGLKPVHRRILYTMFENGLSPDKAYRKCADTVGAVLGRYHPHGDASVYDALVRMAQDFSLRYPLVDGHGNFGSVDGDPPAAYRYTEARMSKMSMEMLTDIGKETVDFLPNYDDRLKEPQVLPSRFPNLLVNGSTGIAVGMATNIPPHNLNEVVDALELLIENPDATLGELMEKVKGPDFPTGGIIMGYAGMRAAYATGRGKILLRAKTAIEEHKGHFRIVVTEIPYMVNKARLIISIAELVKDKRVEGISDLRDESDREGMRIVIELKRDVNPQVILNQLFSFTQLQETVGVIMIALVNGEPKLLTLKQMLEHYLDFQTSVITKRTQYELRKARERSHILEGFMIALDNIDEVISILRSSRNIPEGKQRLMERFSDEYLHKNLSELLAADSTQQGLTEEQADAIVALRFGQLTGMEREKIEKELAELLEKIRDYLDILSDGDRVLAIISQEISEIRRRFGDERRTQIEAMSGEVDIEDLIPVEDCVVTYTNIGYIKRQPVDVYKTQKRGGRGVSGMKQREEDYVEEMFICSTHDNVLFITNKGMMYKLKCYEIPEGSKAARGVNIVNLLPLGSGEKVAAMIKASDFSEGRYVILVTKSGIIKRTPLTAYKNVRKNGLIAIDLVRRDENGEVLSEDEIAGVLMTNGKSELIVATRGGMAIRIRETDMRPMSRAAHGVRAIRLREGDEVVSMARIREGATIVTVTDRGQGRRTEISNYRIQNRGGFGLLNYKAGDEKGWVCGVKVVDDTDDLILISDNGVIIRIRVGDIRVMGRYATGVRVMRLDGDARLVAFTRAEHDDSAEVAEVEQSAEPDPAGPEDGLSDPPEGDMPDEGDDDGDGEDILSDSDETPEY